MRETVAAGRFYDRDETLLKDEIAAHYNGPRGPGAPPLRRIEHRTRAIIVPNSPYANCGDCMAWAYKTVAESPLADVYVIIATNQHSQESGVSLTTYQTPLGFARIDQELAKSIVDKGTIGVNEEIHARDHTIEVQLPFLQHAKYNDLEHIKILPILLSKGTDVRKLALDIKESLVELKRNAVFIVSTGFTHYGPLFHYVPFSLDVKENIYALDKSVIDRVLAQDPEGFRASVEEKMLRMHGSWPVELLLRILKPCDARLEQYYTSGDVLGDYKNSVSYAAIVFEDKADQKPASMREI